MRIALLEDDPEQAKVMRLWLESAGHTVHEFERSRDLLRQAGRESFDLFLVDWMIPDMHGIDALKWLRSNFIHGIKEMPIAFEVA
mgnify:CR=1 FL=1